ncbi:MAG: FixH family protein [Chloroflexi bacterium OHK40]
MQCSLARRFTSLVLAAGFLIILTACGATSGAATLNRQEQTVEGVTIALQTAAAPRMNDAQQLVVTLTDSQGMPLEGADVYLDLDMPAMSMGTNRPILSPGADGTYRGQTAFTMSGEWTVTVVVDINGQERRATFTVAVQER